MYKRAYLFVVAAFAGTLGCDAPETIEPNDRDFGEVSSVSGRVLDYQTGRGLSGVHVTLSGAAAVVTDSSGLYRIPSPEGLHASGVITIRAHAPGFDDASAAVDMSADSIRIPLLFLRSRPVPVVIGPEGGIIEGKGFSVEIPAGALESPMTLWAMPTYPRVVEVSGAEEKREIQGLDLQPHGLRFSRPIRVTLSLPPSYSRNRDMDLLTRDHSSGAWYRMGHAQPSGENGSAQFFVEIFPMDEVAIASNAIYKVTSEGVVTSVPIDSSPDSPCGHADTKSGVVTSPAYNKTAESHTPPLFDNQYINNYMNTIQQQQSGSISVLANSNTQIVKEVFIDRYSGTEQADIWELDQNGQKKYVIGEIIKFTYDRTRTVYKVSRCHMQGAS